MIQIHPGDGWVKRQFKKKTAVFVEKYGNDSSEGVARFGEIFLHNLPYLLFISLPFFAGILNLLYIRRKNYYFSDHAVFTLHHYILSFIIMLLIFILGAFQQRYRVGFLGYAMLILRYYLFIIPVSGHEEFLWTGNYENLFKVCPVNFYSSYCDLGFNYDIPDLFGISNMII